MNLWLIQWIDSTFLYGWQFFMPYHESFQIMFFMLQLHKMEETGHKKKPTMSVRMALSLYSDLPS